MSKPEEKMRKEVSPVKDEPVEEEDTADFGIFINFAYYCIVFIYPNYHITHI